MLKCLSDWKYFKIKAWIVFIDYKFEKWTFTEYMLISTDISIAISFFKINFMNAVYLIRTETWLIMSLLIFHV